MTSTPHARSHSIERPASAALCCALLALVAWSCRATEEFKDPSPEILAWSTPLPVTLSNELRGMKARTSAAGAKTRFKVGKLLQRLFLSSDGRFFLSYVDAKIDLSWRESSWRTRYTLILALQREGTYHLIQASGVADSSESSRDSGKKAIEGCVADLYRQVASLLPSSAVAGSSR